MSGAGLARIKRWRILAPFRVLRARPQLVASVLLGLLIDYLLPSDIGAATRVLIAWNLAVLSYFLLALVLHSGATHESIRATAQRLDEGRAAILLLITAATVASFVAIVLHLGDVKTMHGLEKVVGVGLTAATVVNSWLLLHLSFAFHYAHEYYTEEAWAQGLPPRARGGLNFPATRMPQYLDFLYFSYVIGVACQTADVETCSPTMRAIALFHGVVSFFFNTTILALLVNIASQFV